MEYCNGDVFSRSPITGMSESEQFLKGTSQIKILSADDIEGMRVVSRVIQIKKLYKEKFTINFVKMEQYIMFFFFYLQLAREVLDIAALMVKPGVTTEEIDHTVHLV